MTGRHAAGEDGMLLPGLCSILGTMLFVLVIAVFLPITVPRLLGYEAYEVISESMEPEIPVGSAVYVRAVDPGELSEGEIIAFQSGDSVITHRILENDSEERQFITKGDANNREDMKPVRYESLIGRVEFHIPVIGTLMALLSDSTGKICAAFAVLWGVILHLFSGVLRTKREK